MEQFTADHQEMRQWLEAHGGFPAMIAGTTLDQEGRPSTVELSFNPSSSELRQLPWPEFFEWVEYHQLALRYDESAPDGLGMFELVDRERAEEELSPDSDSLDSGDPEVLRENTIPDTE